MAKEMDEVKTEESVALVDPAKLSGLKKLWLISAKLRVDKTRVNSFAKYNYRSAEDILAALKPLTIECHVYININDEIVQLGSRYYIKAVVTAYDTDTGDVIMQNHAYAREQEVKRGNDEAQVTGATSSYARKYALTGMFNLSPADVNEEGPVIEPDAEKRAAPPKKRMQGISRRDQMAYDLETALHGEGIVDVDDFARFTWQQHGVKSWNDVTEKALDWLGNHLNERIATYKTARNVA